MKNLIVLLAVLFLGCNLYPDSSDYDKHFMEKATGHSLYWSNDFMDIESVEEVPVWVLNHVEYVFDDVGTDIWSNPEVTLNRGYGDAEDIALLIINIVYLRFDIKFDLLLVDMSEYFTDLRSVISGGYVNHATIGYYGTIYNMYNLEMILEVPVGYAYSFDWVFIYTAIDPATVL